MNEEKKREEAAAAAAEEEKEIEIEVTDAPAEEEQTEETQTEEAEATIDQWREALETAVKQRDEYLALAQRAQADYQNFKRRNQQTRTEAYDEGARETITAMLPVLDNLERAIAAAEGESEALVSGVKMVHRQMVDALTKLGLEEVPALGEMFDPDVHNAVMKTTEGEPGTVTEVFEKGYRVKGRMIRYAMVKIAVEE